MINPNSRGGLRKVAILGNFLPRQCGIATFTTDLSNALDEADPRLQVDVVAMIEAPGAEYPPRVVRQLMATDLAAYAEVAAFLNEEIYQTLSVQHEYGIYGGEAGEYLLTLLRSVNMPIVTTMHTVLAQPSAAQRRVTKELIELSERIVVMSEAAIQILWNEYGLSRDRVDFIPHGIPDFSQVKPSNIKESLGLKGPMILTFGLLSPDKGVQYAIEAMPRILGHNPEASFVILGATHPKVKEFHGESYRTSLEEQAERLGVADRVHFVDQFVALEELIQYLAETDVYVTPSLNPKQITSGTLAYALGGCKAVISTPYPYATELLAKGRGILVPFRDPTALADAVISVLAGECVTSGAADPASWSARTMLWSEVGKRYIASFVTAIRLATIAIDPPAETRPAVTKELDPAVLALQHFSAMTDDTGLFQHAIRSIPNRAHGYCVDDNARGLLLTTMLEQLGPLSPRIESMQNCFLSFVQDSYNPDNGRFRNFMSFRREWLEPLGSDDSHARTLWALGTHWRLSSKRAHREIASELFCLGAEAVHTMESPRAWSYAILAANEVLHAYPSNPEALFLMTHLSRRLLNEYEQCHSSDWRWFEEVVSYANARMSQAMILAGQRLADPYMLECGLESLTWLMDQQESDRGYFRGIGSNGHFWRGSTPALYDQQPLEAWASVSACITAAQVTGDSSWHARADNAFAWFHGHNDLGVPVFDAETGGCRDAIHADRLNENEGAESTLSFLCALAEMKSALIPSGSLMLQKAVLS